MATNDTACDVWIVCALAEEAKAAIKAISDECDVEFQADYARENNQREYQWAIVTNERGEALNVRISWAPNKGPQEMALHLQALLREMPARFVGMTGVCAGERDKTALGDLIIGERAFFYEPGKIVLDDQSHSIHQHDTETWGPSLDTLQYARSFEGWKPLVSKLFRRPTRRQQRDWLIDYLQQNQKHSLDKIPDDDIDTNAPDILRIIRQSPAMFTSKYKLTPPAQRLNRRLSPAYQDPKACQAHIVPVASADAGRADAPFAEIQTPIHGALALEMEGATFYRVINQDFPGVHSLLVKGVCDYTDPEKDDSYQDYAAKASALYMLSFLQRYVHEELAPSSRTGSQTRIWK